MVDILLLQTVSLVVASASIVVAAVYYILQIQHQKKLRQTDMAMRIYEKWESLENQKAYVRILSPQFEDYEDYLRRFQQDFDTRAAVSSIGLFFEGIGTLFKRKLISIDLVDDLISTDIIRVWEKIKPIAEGLRRKRNRPQIYEWFEYLYDEMKKREQTLQQSKA